ncbi:glycosyltransferase [Arthrobacter gengyunqii]|uniref:Glycosyltransferase n=1 Tax=Arthrobacter gengyunqii TaxID=2886940 RepID=A0A9X1M332_9MICC|nr:glycosyltransferase [Arthrobacter gengyunqii]MCC3269925.1 glycosyltransferase [Arthrobacter gengyunqii]UOY95144.1 glycosyltransferase [Arthrobacter gengyunqii]
MSSSTTEPNHKLSSIREIPEVNIAHGRIDSISQNSISGWLYSPTRDVTPFLMVDGRPARLVEWPTARGDVSKALGVADNTGFKFQVDGADSGAEIELFALNGQMLYKTHHRRLEDAISDTNIFRQLDNIASIAREKDSVAVTSWDGAHNPIGRAKVLYDIAKTRRPTALITYLFKEFGGQLWEPIRDSNIDLLTIPWDDRARYHRILRQMNVNFPTVWICKPRLPNFELASHLASKDAKLILDFDDNEDYFSRSQASRTKIYGLTGLGYSKYFQARVHARTVASTTLQESFGGEMVRHARLIEETLSAVTPSDSEKLVAFIGTVRPHKNILAAAKSISVFNWRYNLNVKFHVYGDVQPESLRKQLVEQGVELGGIVPARELQACLSDMDVVLTGFPSSNEMDNEVTKYQITSKIGDGLAAKKPVLTPMGPSVADLAGVPGLFLFDETNFPQKLIEALALPVEDISLPQEFTLSGAYDNFSLAEIEAGQQPRASEVFERSVHWQERDNAVTKRPTLLLIWKQHDASIYGRRIDQVARAYKARYPDHHVRVLELLHERQEEQYVQRSINHLSDATNVLGGVSEKLRSSTGGGTDDVAYDMIRFRSSATLEESIFKYLTDSAILPSNSVLVLYPFIQFYEVIQDLLSSYIKIVDVVDNQFSWSVARTDRSRQISVQYNAMMATADAVVFNSAVNMQYFLEAGFITKDTAASVVPNWYRPPLGVEISGSSESKTRDSFDIVYSGNMNDRINWGIIRTVAMMNENIIVHLIGAAERAPEGFYETLQLKNVVYHGPQTERYSLRLLTGAHLGIMPHVSDEVSNYMNPMKLHMYKAVGVPIVATRVEGIDPEITTISVAESDTEFFEEVSNRFLSWKNELVCEASEVQEPDLSHQDQYLEMIEAVAPWSVLRSTDSSTE